MLNEIRIARESSSPESQHGNINSRRHHDVERSEILRQDYITQYDSKESFIEAIRPLLNPNGSLKDVESGKTYGPEDIANIDLAWNTYRRSYGNSNDLILGRYKNARVIDNCTSDFPCIDQKIINNFGATSDSSPPERSGGAIVFETWSHLVNDALILGALHHANDFLLASPRTKENCWDAKNDRLTVNGREMVAIHASKKYSFVRSSQDHHNFLGESCRFDHSQESTMYGFPEYMDDIYRYRSDHNRLQSIWEARSKKV